MFKYLALTLFLSRASAQQFYEEEEPYSYESLMELD